MMKAAGQLAVGPCWIMTACFTLVVGACQSSRPQPNSDAELRSARLEAKVEHLSDEPAPIADRAPGSHLPEQAGIAAETSQAASSLEEPGAPVPTTPAAPSAPPAMADHALLKAAGAPRAASLTKAEAHSFIRLKSSIERANATARRKKLRSP
jgi:hypothetical protein